MQAMCEVEHTQTLFVCESEVGGREGRQEEEGEKSSLMQANEECGGKHFFSQASP